MIVLADHDPGWSDAFARERRAILAAVASSSAYGALKRRLVAAHGDDHGAYTEGKSAFARAVEAAALRVSPVPTEG